MFKIQSMDIEKYEEVYAMWSSIPGIRLSSADSKSAISSYLKRNPNLSFICADDDKIVGTILCGHDGRRGFIHHTCVLPEYQGQGIGKALVEKALEALKKEEIEKCHLFVVADNEAGNKFWSKMGWDKREDIFNFSKEIK
ncbi:GNAT family N-acetyltransferase [Clostridium sp. 19966]|uniref:GNAT family N-acetyltransferase n=1 Tax=Clostridium sp. 19966 TaxID=2768166 RepID=UPI0028DEEB08|nr:GNAT family N-acetyltransferase [Clostridium sp. 19966]MDT8716865.1 GNAT family N-acetyltransferase [Clostridium sp. 19966]